MTTCPCPTCGKRSSLIDQYQETGTYHCGQCGTLAAKVGDSVRVQCLPTRANCFDELLAAARDGLKFLDSATEHPDNRKAFRDILNAAIAKAEAQP